MTLGPVPKWDKMVDAELGTQWFIFNFWADAMKIQRSYCNGLLRFTVSLPVNRVSSRVSVRVCEVITDGKKLYKNNKVTLYNNYNKKKW